MSGPSILRVAAYARTSLLLRQDPENQLVHIRQYVESRKSAQLTNEYIDQITGTSDKRPALDKLLNDIKRRKVDVVVIAALDRLGRNAAHLLKLAEVFKEYDVGLVSLREAIDLNTPSGKAFFTILAAISELDRNQIAERIRCALAAKKVIAERTGNGWKCGRPTKLSVELAAEIIRLRNEGQSLRQIARKLSVSKTTVLRVVQNHSQEIERTGA